ncbi:coiled-coil domain-containing protein 157 [Oryzias melastigma]|uniref:coiled-coil domain-containing protein 157 n=1 Tax=Oryzias melastigma TaxID=30732 RepID=UPI000CF7F7E4|nr:coiled-coil domain-containing protein 157 [Oryzias melastigma]
MMEKDKRLSELKEQREMGKRRLQSQQAELEAKKNHLKKETKFKETCGLRAAALRDKLERLQQAAKAKQASEDRKTEAHTLALEKLAMLKKELLEKRNYNLEMTQRLKVEEEEEAEPEVVKDQMEAEEITISAPLSEPEVMKDQVQDEEIAISVPLSEPEVVKDQVQDEEITISVPLSEPEVVKDQVQDEEITTSAPLSEPEVLKDQVQDEEIIISVPPSEPEVVMDQVQDEEITISVPPSEPEEVSKQIELALDKLATLHKELLEKRNYKLELTQRLEMEKKAGSEVVKDQVQDEEITISAPLSEPEEVLKQTEAEKTDAFIAPQMENEDSESGHHLREQPDALPSVETKKKKRSLWKRFKSFFTPRHRQKNKPKA